MPIMSKRSANFETFIFEKGVGRYKFPRNFVRNNILSCFRRMLFHLYWSSRYHERPARASDKH
jgi:hypothetical protein